jgi:hypothetical protein
LHKNKTHNINISQKQWLKNKNSNPSQLRCQHLCKRQLKKSYTKTKIQFPKKISHFLRGWQTKGFTGVKTYKNKITKIYDTTNKQTTQVCIQ